MSGIREGFRVGFDYSHSCWSSPPNMSALEKPEVVTEYLAEEYAEGQVLGPFVLEQLPKIHTSHFGVIKKGKTGRWQLILYMSSPEGASVNDGFKESLCSLSYVGTKDAAWTIVAKGRGALLAKV